MLPESMNMIEQKKRQTLSIEIFMCFLRVSQGIFPQIHFKFSPIDDIAAHIKKHSHFPLLSDLYSLDVS